MKNLIKKINNKCILFYCLIFSLFVKVDIVFGMDLLNNPITTGLKKLGKDALNLLMILATIACPVLIGFYQFRKKMSDDEMDCKHYDKKTKAIIFCYIVIMSVSVILSIIGNYFGISTPA